jgi:tRNA (mo5U34)-methyltransferase
MRPLPAVADAALRRAVALHPLWYHSIELAEDLVTPGWFDLRPIVETMPWPDVAGKRCLDVGTYDGFLAVELERRGAAEVVATDIGGHEDWDWLPRDLARGAEKELGELAGEKGAGFCIAAEALESSVRREVCSIYDLTPDRFGTFDVVVCGSLLLHLRDPFRALAAVRSVCSGVFLSAETIDLPLTVSHPRRPSMHIVGSIGQWAIPNAAGHAAMLETAGFDVIEQSRPYSIPYGPSHPPLDNNPKQLVHAGLQRTLGGRRGVPTHAVLCRPI